ncbi:MAG: LacI family transcriptional regulator [Eubacteriales bacterium]|nr:LacI family transcriptional regulator [Eubacteriales bacterium]
MKPASGAKRVLLQDIAIATGYTVNTVSRALQNKYDISKSTCAHIQKVADEMGYVRNNIASSLRSGKSRTLAVIVGEASNPFYAIMIDTIHDIAEGNGYTVMVLCSRDKAEQEQKAIVTSIGRQVDGVLLFPSNHTASNLAMMRQSGIPFVLVSRHLENPDYDSVVCDEETGGYLAGKHLIQAGHRKLAFVYFSEVVFSSEQRTRGLLRAAREAGIPAEDVHFFQRGTDAQTVAQLRQWKAEGVTGIFVFCDIEAWQLYDCMNTCGMKDDFSLVGFDNIQGVIGFPSPLCTVDGAMREVAKAAFLLLMERIRGDVLPPKSLMFPVRLVCRGSCRPPDGKPLNR